MFARVTSIQGKPEDFDRMIGAITGDVIPAAQKIPGFKGGTWLGDRKTGKGLGITFWASEDELKASKQAADQLRSEATKKIGSTILSVEEFEVVAQA